MRSHSLTYSIVLFLSLFAHTQALADEVWLKNGDRITGKIGSLEKKILTVDTSYAGKLAIEWEEVARIRTDEPVTTVFAEKSTLRGVISPGDGGWATIKPGDMGEPVTVELSRIKAINPKPPEPALKTKIRINAGANFTSGNTDTENIYGDGELGARTEKNRYTLTAAYKRSEDSKVKTADSVIGAMKYDHFIRKKVYLFTVAEGERDPFKDLDLRSSLGVGAGYQFYETEFTTMQIEAGASYVNEDYTVSSDNNYTAGRWSFKFDRYLFKKALQFFHNHTGLQSFEDSKDLVIYTQTGLRVPLLKHLNSTVQFNYDYDKSPAPGKDKDDRAVIVTFGFQWGD